jgi:hypothetical protein
LIQALSENSQNGINDIAKFLEQREDVFVIPVVATPYIFVRYAPSAVSQDDFYIARTYWEKFTALEHLRDHSYSIDDDDVCQYLFSLAT